MPRKPKTTVVAVLAVVRLECEVRAAGPDVDRAFQVFAEGVEPAVGSGYALQVARVTDEIVAVVRDFVALSREADMRPEDACCVLYQRAQAALAQLEPALAGPA